MSSKASLFKETDIKRGARAVHNAGFEIASIDIDRSGKISIVLKSKTAVDDAAPKNAPASELLPEPWDD